MIDELDAEKPDDDSYALAAECSLDQRAWLRAIVPILQNRSHDSDPSPRVQFAFDMMYVAACERVRRILGSDLPTA